MPRGRHSSKKWAQRAVPTSHEGRFTQYCKGKGYSGVTGSCIRQGMHSKNVHVRKMANLARTFRKMSHRR